PDRAPPAVVPPESTMNKLLPMLATASSTRVCAPFPIAIMSTTAPTPMTRPSIVRKVRSLLAAIARQASRSMLGSMSGNLRKGEPRCWCGIERARVVQSHCMSTAFEALWERDEVGTNLADRGQLPAMSAGSQLLSGPDMLREETIMKRITPILAGALLALSTSAFSAEFNNQCAWGLANGKNVPTDCKINMTRSDGK